MSGADELALAAHLTLATLKRLDRLEREMRDLLAGVNPCWPESCPGGAPTREQQNAEIILDEIRDCRKAIAAGDVAAVAMGAALIGEAKARFVRWRAEVSEVAAAKLAERLDVQVAGLRGGPAAKAAKAAARLTPEIEAALRAWRSSGRPLLKEIAGAYGVDAKKLSRWAKRLTD